MGRGHLRAGHLVSADLGRRLDQLAQGFLAHLEHRNYRPRTIQSYRRRLAEFARWVEQRPELEGLADITLTVLSEYGQHLLVRPKLKRARGRGYVPTRAQLTGRTRQGLLSPLKLWFRWLVKRHELLTDPAAELELPRAQRRLPRAVLAPAEVAKLLVAPPADTPVGLRDRALLELFYGTGIRRAEALGLVVKDLNLAEGELLIRGKGGRERLVPVGEEALHALADYLARGRPNLPTPEAPYLFLSSHSGPLKFTEVHTRLKEYARLAGLEKKPVTPHALRHACATHLLRQGADIRHIQALLGHSSLSSTEVYTRVELSQLRQVLLRCHPRERGRR